MKTRFLTIASEISKRTDILSVLNSDDDLSKLFDLPDTLPSERVNKYKLLYKGIGKTPVYRVALPGNNRLHIKTECFNPMGNTHYSRLWIPYLFIAEVLHVIEPDKTNLIEVTSGNSGIALAMACKELNYPLTLVVPSFLPNGRINPMLEYGAKIAKVDGYVDKCIHKLRRLIVSNIWFPCNHSEETADIQIKIMRRIAAEYIKDYNNPDFAIVGLGNGTTTRAIFEYLKKVSQITKTVSYYPDPLKEEIVLGLYRPFNLKHINPSMDLSDFKIVTTGRDLMEVRNFFNYDTEINNFGYSSLYAIHIALEMAKVENNKTFLTLAYDRSDRYV